MTGKSPVSYILIFLLALLTGCAQLRPAPDSDYAIWDRSRDRWITESELVADLRKTDFVLIGELHQSPFLHERLLETLKQLKKDQWLEAIVLDSLQAKFNTEEPTYIDQLQKLSEEALQSYQPLIEWVEQEQVPLVAAAIPRNKLESMKKAEARDWLNEKTRGVLTGQEQEQLREIMASSHPGSKEASEQQEKLEYMLAAQRLQDYFMARMLLALKQNSVLITRAFHARNDLGVRPYLTASKPDSRIKSILMVSSMQNRDSLMQRVAPTNGEYDYIWLKASEKGFLLAPQEERVSAPVDESAPGK